MRGVLPVLLLALLPALLPCGAVPPAAAARPAFPPFVVLDDTDGRPRESVILLRRDCRSDLGRREVTLFADGTVRLREEGTVGGREDGPGGEEPELSGGTAGVASGDRMLLERLDPDSLDGYRARLGQLVLGDEVPERDAVSGAWLVRCTLEVRRPGRTSGAEGRSEESVGGPVSRFRYARASRLPLGLSRASGLADELAELAERSAGAGLPRDYRPRRGDVLERVDGALFQVVGRTEVGEGVELQGVEAPLVEYVAEEELRRRFVRLVSRGGGGGS